MAGGDSLSDLPDDLLRRVLHFAPAREGASTNALSKRWRGLWRSSGAVNLDARVPEGVNYGDLFSWREAFVSAARLAFEDADAGGSPVTRLTFSVETDSRDRARKLLYHNIGWHDRSPDVVTELLSLPAARHVQELRLDAGYSGWHLVDQEYLTSSYTGFGKLSFLCLLSDTLHVLDVTGCQDLHPSPSVTFPQLASLRLCCSSVTIEHLQDVIDAAPTLGTVYLESVKVDVDGKGPPPEVVRLHCRGVTELLMDSCGWPKEWRYCGGTTAVEIDGPRLRRFTYNGLLRPLSLTSQTPNLERVHLHIFPDTRYNKDAARNIETFWRCAHNFSNAKELKLRVDMLEDIAVVGSANRAKLLCSFPNLELLQLEGMHRLQGKTAAVAVANLLMCCPVLRDIRINLALAQTDSNRGTQQGRRFLEKKYRRDLEKSIHGFMNRRLEPVVSVEGDCDDDGGARYDRLSDLPALSGQDFPCLHSSLCCVRLQFRPETNIVGLQSTSFEVRLIKFFAENAAVLKEMHIHGGNGKMGEHINRKLERWVTTNSTEKRKSTFVVLPLEVIS